MGIAETHLYHGLIDESEIDIAIYRHSDRDVRAVYAYKESDSSIVIDGEVSMGSLILYERNHDNSIRAVFTLEASSLGHSEMTGVWVDKMKAMQRNVRLTRDKSFKIYDQSAFGNLEILQSQSGAEHYFRLLISKSAGEEARVSGIRIYEKGSDRLLQEIRVQAQYIGLDSIAIDDYNFDGVQDLSVFETGYAGPNTSSIYILQKPVSSRYFISEFSGTSLSFDAKAERIYEHNQCCAGRRHINSTYKVVENKMVLLEEKCIEFDDQQEEFIACQ